MNAIPLAARLHIRTIDLNIGSLCYDYSLMKVLSLLLQGCLPEFWTIHLTLQQEARESLLLAIIPLTLSHLLSLPHQKLIRIRLSIDDTFEENNNLTLPCFQIFLTSLTNFPYLSEFEIYFQTIRRGYMKGSTGVIPIQHQSPHTLR